MTNPKSGSSAASNNYNLLTDNEKFIKNKKVKTDLLNQARKSVFEALNLDETLVNRATTAKRIYDRRKDPLKVPTGEMELRLEDPKFPINLDDSLNKHKDLKGRYELAVRNGDNYELERLDSEFAERLILDVGGSIEFKPKDKFVRGENAKEESEIAFNNLNGLTEYTGKIELVTRFLDGGDAEGDNYYVIKWKEKWIKEVRKKYNELLKAEGDNGNKEDGNKEGDNKEAENNHEGNDKDKEIEELKQKYEELLKKSEGNDEKHNKEIEELKQKYEELLAKAKNEKGNDDSDEKKGGKVNSEESEGENGKDNEKKDAENEKMKEMEALIKKLMEDGKEKDRRISELENLVREGGKDNKAEEKDTNEEDTDNKKNDIDDENDSEENSETLDEDSNYISRNFVEGLIVGIRGAEGYPKGTIRIREEVINIEEFEFYEEFKQEYIEAKGDATRLSRLDKEFAEMIILFSPKGADYKDKYCIKLSEAELKDGLYVSEERLARYGVMIKVSEYFEKVVEREVIRERTIVRKLETVITELQTSIVELTRSISIEKSSSTIILEEIRRKRKLLLALIKRQKVLLASLRGLDNNDEELKKLREEEARLQKEYEALQKEKEKQNKLKKEIDEIKKKIAGLENNDKKAKLKNSIDGKKKEADEIKDEIKNLEKERDSYKWRLENGTITADEIVSLKSNIEKLNKQIDKLKSDLKKLEDEIKELESQLEGDDEISKLEKEIANKKAERKKLQEKLWELTAEDSLQNNETYHDIEARDAEIEKIEKELKIKDDEIKELEAKKNALGNGEKDSEELKKLKKRLTELEEQLDPNIDKKLKAKKKELDDIQKEIKDKEKNGNRSELEIQLIAIIEEQEALLVELEELEHLLIIAKTEKEKIEIKEKIRIINKKLTIISQKITEFESFIQIYKSRITIKRYQIFQVVPFGPIPVPNKPFEMTSVISDMGTDVFKEKAALKVEEELKRQYDGLGRWQIGSRLALFLGRGSKRKKMMRNEMNNMANTAFQTGAGYATLNDQSQNAADRHAHELLTNMAAVNRITTVHNVQVDQLCRDYLNNVVNDATFQQRFNAIVAADANIQSILQGQNITHIGTNILLQLREQKALNTLITALDGQLNQYIATGNPIYMHNMQNYVETYIKQYQKLPAFKANFEQFLQGNLNARNQLRRYLSHQKAIMNMQITNLRMNIDILNRGKSAYQIDNKDREKGWKYKVGHFMDKHPWGTAIGTLALSVGLGLATAPMGAVAGAAVTTGVFGSYVGFTNYIKKWTHHTKEQNTHEKNVVTDYRNEQAKIQNWQNTALNGHGRKKYKAKRQLALYDQTTQDNIRLSDQITEYITNLSAKSGPLTANENNFMKLNLIEGWARLKYYRAMGHNFLASENVDKTEKDMRRLEKAITLGLQKIGQNTNDIENNMTATNGLGTNITYNVIQNDLKASYDKSLIQFKRERRWLALRYGIGTAALSIGTALGLQYLTGSGVFSKDIPGTPGTPGTPSSTSNHPSGTDNFGLGKYDIPGTANYADSGNIYSNTKSLVSSSSIPDGSHAVINYGVGTDGTTVRAGSLGTKVLKAQLKTVEDNINAMPWGTHTAQRDAFLTELGKLKSIGFTNDNLATMRAAEELEHYAQGIADGMATSGKNIIVDGFNRGLDRSGALWDNVAERFMTGSIDITTPAIPGTPGTPGIPAKTWGRWIMGVPLFFNTFKKRKPTKDTTDQNFGKNNQNNNQNNNRRPQP